MTTPDTDALRLVPVEPTEAMLQGGCSTHKPGEPMSDLRDEECPSFVRRRKIWADMLAAAPPAPASPEAVGAGRRELLERLEAEVSDETMRALLSCKDVGSGRAHLARILAALSPASPAPTPMGGEVEALREAINLILPLAKGYVAKNNVGSNQSYVEHAEALAASSPSPAQGGVTVAVQPVEGK